ncbi:tetratricopeptide repeat protein [Candidatus Borreliella tachyglossi]|uniref:tetratricopeptide repeat protein n=1 Tax=Candidatus Borreliella tachyglossi TaxID=1964448 RepID=UPI004043469E
MNKFLHSQFLLILNISFLHASLFTTLHQEFEHTLENYHSGVVMGVDNKSDFDYVNYYVDRLKSLREGLDALEDTRTEYLCSDINFQIASMIQHAKGNNNSSESYSILVSTKKDIMDLISSEGFGGLEALIRSDAYRILGDINLSLLKYLGGMELVKLSNEAKGVLEKSLGIDSKNALANIALATWYLYSPRIAGGNPRKTIEFARKGLEYSQNNVEKYLASIWLSQGYFLLKEDNERIRYLDEASKIFPDGTFHKMVVGRNKLGDLP